MFAVYVSNAFFVFNTGISLRLRKVISKNKKEHTYSECSILNFQNSGYFQIPKIFQLINNHLKVPKMSMSAQNYVYCIDYQLVVSLSAL